MEIDDRDSNAADPPEDHHDQEEKNEDSKGYVLVQAGGKTRRITKAAANAVTIVGKTPPRLKRTGAFVTSRLLHTNYIMATKLW